MRRVVVLLACAAALAVVGCTKEQVPSRAFTAFDLRFAGWLREASGDDWHEGGGGGGGLGRDGRYLYRMDRTYVLLRAATQDRAAKPIDLADVTGKLRAKVAAALAEAGVQTQGTGTGQGFDATYTTGRGAGGISVYPYVDASSDSGSVACFHVYFWEAGR